MRRYSCRLIKRDRNADSEAPNSSRCHRLTSRLSNSSSNIEGFAAMRSRLAAGHKSPASKSRWRACSSLHCFSNCSLLRMALRSSALTRGRSPTLARGRMTGSASIPSWRDLRTSESPLPYAYRPSPSTVDRSALGFSARASIAVLENTLKGGQSRLNASLSRKK